MPKNKRPIESTRTSSRRQASKEALKQMQLLLDDEDDDAFVIPDDDEDKRDIRFEIPHPPPPKKRAISPMMETPPPKKKYKLSHRKSSDGNDRDVIVLKSISNSSYVPKENTLELECFIEELSDVQKERLKKSELEEQELEAKLEELLKGKQADVVYKGEITSAVEVNELISNCGKKSVFKPSELPQLDEMGEQSTPTYNLVMDPRLGIIVGTIPKRTIPKTSNQVQISSPTLPKNKLQISAAVKSVASIPQNSTATPTRMTRTRKTVTPTPPAPIQTRGNNSIPTRANSQGVTTRGNTPRSNIATPTRGVPQIANPAPSPSVQTRGMKTTPTIQTRNNKATPPPTGKRPITIDKPSKQVVDLTSEENRNQADNREISFNKLQGKTYPSLVVVARPHLRVSDLGVDRSKLDSKVKTVLMHPPTKFTEWLIQQGLIRSEQKCPVHSNTQLKLGMYSDVSKFPFSGGYVWISECCPQRFVSVFNGSIFEGSPHPPMVMLKLIYHWSCQTNIQNVTQWVKVDNLYVKGVYTWLRGVCTVAVQSRLRQLGGPGHRIEVGVISLGTTSHDGNQRQVKVEVLGVLETSTKYVRLRAVEPMPEGERNFRKKFSKILEPILQWVHPGSTIVTDLTVDKATLHHMGFPNVIQTTSNDYNQSNRTIMEYLRRIVPRMFQNTLSLLSRQIIQQFLDELVWREWFGITSQTAFDNIIAHLAEHTRLNPQTPLVLKLNKVAANPFRCWSNNPQSQVASNSAVPAVPIAAAPTTTTPVPIKTPVSEVKKYGRGKKSNSPQVQVVQERPTKPVSPDVPEQMVPLENYYYGTIDPPCISPNRVTLNMKCPFCKSSFDNNILLQNHLFKHAHNVSNDAYLCRYCLTSVTTANELIHHVNKCHPGETKFDYGFVCLICEIHYMNPFVLGKHMSKEHIPHELPYQCGSCSFRCSNHKQVIDHFYLRHDGDSTIQCPFCLKSTTVWSSGRNVAQNIHYFIQHLQKHQKKQFAKRCGKCNLWFVQKENLKEHQQKMHISLRGKMGLVPYLSPRNGVMVPKSKIDKNPCDAEVINFSSLYYNLAHNSVCKECNQTISSSKHFPSFDNCQNPNCQYSTCCAIAMMTHNAKCKGLNSVIPPEELPYEMFCVCGFRDVDGNSMAKHLAICEKKAAYPSEAEAKSATVMHSMLDILGLVRKPEESKNEKSSDSTEKNEDTENPSKVHNKEEGTSEVNILSDEEMETEKSKEVTPDEINSGHGISEKVPTSENKKDEQTAIELDKISVNTETNSDKHDEISDDEKTSVNENSNITDLNEENMMSETLSESSQCNINETVEKVNTELSNHICDKTEKTETDHLSIEKNEHTETDPIPEIAINDANSIPDNEDKTVNTSPIEKEYSVEQKNQKNNMGMEVDEDQTEIIKEDTEEEIVKGDVDENIVIQETNLDNSGKDLEADHIEEGMETEPTDIEFGEVPVDRAEEKHEADHIEKDIATDHTKEEILEDQISKEFEEDHTENIVDENIQADPIENEVDAKHTEEEIQEDPVEKEVQADHIKDDIVADPIEKEIISDQTEEEIPEDPIDKEVHADLTGEGAKVDDSEDVEAEVLADHTEKGIEVDYTKEDIEEDSIKKDVAAEHTEIENEADHTEEEIRTDHMQKEVLVDHTEKKNETDQMEEETRSDSIGKEDTADHSEEENQSDYIEKEQKTCNIEEGMEIDLIETEIEGQIVKATTNDKTSKNNKEEETINSANEEGAINCPNEEETINCPNEEEPTNCPNEEDSDKKSNSEECDNYWSTEDSREENNTEGNLESLQDSGLSKNIEYINEEVPSIESKNERSQSSESNNESMQESVSETTTDTAKNVVIQEREEPCTPQVKSNDENNLTIDAIMDCSEISTSSMEKNELSEILDNDKLLHSEPCIESVNENVHDDVIMKDISPADNVKQDSITMEVD